MGASLHEAIRFRLSPTPPTVRRIARYHYGIELLRGWQQCAQFVSKIQTRMQLAPRLQAIRGCVRVPSPEALNLAAAASQRWIVIGGLIVTISVKICLHHLP